MHAYEVPARKMYAREVYAYEVLESRSVIINEDRDRCVGIKKSRNTQMR